MQTQTGQENYIQTLTEHYRSIQRLAGDQRLREMLSAEREVTSSDRQMTTSERADLLRAFDQIEAVLLPSKN